MTIRSYNNIDPDLADTVYIDETALVIGDVKIGANSSVWPMSVVRGDVHYIRIGTNTNIQDHSVLHVSHKSEYSPEGNPLNIGNYVTVGHRVILHGCTVGDHCVIGMGSTVMDGAVINPGVMLGAGSLVSPNKELESGYLWMGTPAKKIRPLTEKEKSWLRYSAEHYVRMKDQYINEPG